jgi:hydrogenase maturation protease
VSAAAPREIAVAPIVVIGMGNVLLRDDGFGPCVIGMLEQQWEFPDGVERIDAGTPGLDLAGLLCDRDVVIFVDTVAAAGRPGELRIYRDAQLGNALALRPRVSPHDPALAEALAVARDFGDGPATVILVGAIPQSVEVGLGLSAPVSSAARRAADEVVAVLAEWQVFPRPRSKRPEPLLWWTDRSVETQAARPGRS